MVLFVNYKEFLMNHKQENGEGKTPKILNANDINISQDGPKPKHCEPKPLDKQTKSEVVETAKEAHAKLEEITRANSMIRKLNNLQRHIRKVQDAIQILSERLIARGEIDFSKIILANSMTHDLSKFGGIEWEYLVKEDSQIDMDGDKLEMAIYQHVMTNDHHPERWGGIDHMPREAIAEMVCDLYARSQEAGTDLMKYIKEVFVKKHNMSFKGKGYKTMKFFMDILVDKPLKPLQPTI